MGFKDSHRQNECKKTNPLYKTWAQPHRETKMIKKNLKNLIKIFCQNINFCAACTEQCDSFGNKQRVDSIHLKNHQK